MKKPEDRAGEDLREELNELTSSSSSVADRIVAVPEPEEKKPIAPVNGEDVAA